MNAEDESQLKTLENNILKLICRGKKVANKESIDIYQSLSATAVIRLEHIWRIRVHLWWSCDKSCWVIIARLLSISQCVAPIRTIYYLYFASIVYRSSNILSHVPQKVGRQKINGWSWKGSWKTECERETVKIPNQALDLQSLLSWYAYALHPRKWSYSH